MHRHQIVAGKQERERERDDENKVRAYTKLSEFRKTNDPTSALRERERERDKYTDK